MPALQMVEVLPDRGWVPFTPPGHPTAPGAGATLTVRPATGRETAELDALLRACLAGTPHAPEWTGADLRSVLRPPVGGCLVVRTGDGALVAVASTLPADDAGPAAGPEPVLLVHPRFRAHHLGRRLRHALAHLTA